jgi:response regulator RpfG family c-di-GMP phosphodiesterase
MQGSGSYFDPTIVNAFQKAWDENKIQAIAEN